MADDVRRLHAMGYAQELARRLGGFSNFALSLSIICILAGGVTSFHLGLCSVGGASIGLGWPLVSLFALAVAATMGQLASTFPTAGGLYHWSAILGGRGWGWATAWFNLAGLVTVLAAINVGTYRFAMASLGIGPIPAELDLAAQAIGVILITASQAAINHLGIVATARLTDFSGYWILLVVRGADDRPAGLRAGRGPVAAVDVRQLQRLGRRRRLAGDPSLVLLFALGALLPAYTITGFDASAHAAEETVGASASVPRGIVRSVLVSGLAGWVLLSAAVLAAPSLADAAAQGEGAFLWIMRGVLPAIDRRRAVRRDRGGAVPLRAGHGDLGLADGVRLRPRRRPAVLDGRAMGLPTTPIAGRRDLGRVCGLGPLHAAHAGLFDDHGRLHHLPLSLVRAADDAGRPGPRPDLDGDGPVGPRPLVSAAGLAQRGGVRRIDRDRHAAAQRAIGLGRGRLRDRDGRRLVRRRPTPIPRSAARGDRRLLPGRES